MTQETLKELPKIELHCHLDGSLSRSFIEKRLGRTVRPEELSVSENCTSLNEYLEKFDLPGRCIMDEEGLSGAAYDLLSQMNECLLCGDPFCSASVRDKKDGQPEGDRSSDQRNGAGEKRFWNRVWCDRLCNAASQH